MPSPHDHASDRHVQTTPYATWAGDVAALCRAIAALEPLVGPLGTTDPVGSDWHGQLFGKLVGQVAREPVLVAAVCGGTNTGKSLIANALVGSLMSRSVPEAARTVHPVASLPAGRAAAIDVAALFPGFVPTAWTSDTDALDAPEADRLVWREDPTGRQPARLILLDTPDVDGTLRQNWRRAELVRNACDVLIAVLTQQKYNDAAVRDFFRAAAQARKGVIVVFNMVDWPRQRERLGGWLATFTAETGVAPLAVYACPHDFQKAEAGQIDFFAVPELMGQAPSSGSDEPADLAAALAGADFDRLKREAMRGALEVVLDPRHGAAAWLAGFEASAREWHDARQLLADEARVRVELPMAPREVVWKEIWAWLEPRRSTLDLTVSKAYRIAGSGVLWAARAVGLARSDSERREDFAARELAALKQALASFVERLEDASRRNERLGVMLAGALVGGDRAAWYADLEHRHAALPLVSDDYRAFVRAELDRFAAESPDMVRWIVTGLNVGAVARPAITVGLGMAGAAVVPAAAATAGGLTTLVHHVGDIVVGTAATLAGEGALGLTMAGLKPLLERLFAGWSAERGRVLAETLHDVVLGDRVEEIDRLAAAAARPEVAEARRLVFELREEFART
jgi:hypothetical protein